MNISIEQYNKMEERLAELEAKEAERQWVPCSERLPENPTANYDLKEYLVCNARGWVAAISWCDGWNCCFDEDGNLYKVNEMKDIIAWMPMPEPMTLEKE